MDALDRVNDAAADLLGRVDAALAGGAPAGHRIWPLLRWTRVLPGPAVRAVVDLRPPEWTGDPQALAAAVTEAAEPLAAPVPWSGAAGSAYETHRRNFRARLLDPDESVAARLGDYSSYLDDLAGWVAESRVSLALRLATVLRSQAAVTLVTGDDATSIGLAAAEIGAEVLAEIEEILRAGEELEADWAERLAPLDHGPWQPDLPGPAGPTTLRLEL